MLVEKLLGFTLLGAEWVLWLLLILSVVSISLMFERLWVYLKNSLDIESLADEIDNALKNHTNEKIINEILKRDKMAIRVFKQAYETRDRGIKAVKELVESKLAHEKLMLEKNMTFLGTLGNNAPFIGLFGTVIGVIRSFNDLAINTQEGASAVMAGISEALVATGIGLLVAIPAVIAYNFFNRWQKSLIVGAESIAHIVYASMEEENGEEKKNS